MLILLTPVKDCFVLKVSRIQNLPRTSATLHLHFHSISRIRKPREKLLSPADLESLSNSARASPSSLIVMCLYKLLCHKYNIYTESRVKKRNEAHCMQMGFVGYLWYPVSQTINITGEEKAEKKNVTIVTTAISYSSRKTNV